MRSEPVSPPQGAGSSPILSVGVPTYNQAEYLQQTLDSLVNLPRQPLEIVVSENHCTDQTSAILEQYGDAIRVIRPPTHLSMMANWNYLISHLNGEWVVLLSSDDLALPNYVEVLERGTTVSPAAVLVKTSYQRIDRQGRVTKTKHLRATQTVVSPPETLTGQLTGSDVAFGAFAVRRDAWQRAGGFPEQCHLAGDWGFWLRLAPLGDFVYERVPIIQYRNRYRDVAAEKKRSVLWARDYLHIWHDIMPEVARTVGVDDALVCEYSYRKCFRCLSAASAVLEREERAEVVALMAEWAQETGLEDVLARFAAGEVLPRRNYGPVRRTLSRWVRGVGDAVGVRW